jgi:hypothetical protein
MSTASPTPETPGATPARPADHVTAIRFLNLMFDGLDAGFIEFRYFEPGRKRKAAGKPVYLPLPLEHERLSSEALIRAGSQAVALGVAPRWRVPERGGAGKDHDVLEVRCVWADINTARAKGGAVEVLRRIRDFTLRPSAVVNSGDGFQVYFVLRAPLHGPQLLDWEEVSRGLNEALGGTAAGTSQVLLLPGTFNLRESNPVTCEVCEEFSSWTRYDIDELREAVRSAPDPLVYTTQRVSADVTIRAEFSAEQLGRRGLNPQVIEAIITGQDVT